MPKSAPKPKPRRLSLARLADGKCEAITKSKGRTLAEAAMICILHCEHPADRALEVVGEVSGHYLFRWLEVSDQLFRSNADLQDATEEGAVAIAVILIEDATPHRAIERAAKYTGIDYWLGDKGSTSLDFTARLEVSGTIIGEAERIRRVARKLKQTERSDVASIPAYVVVVDFAGFVAEVAKRA